MWLIWDDLEWFGLIKITKCAKNSLIQRALTQNTIHTPIQDIFIFRPIVTQCPKWWNPLQYQACVYILCASQSFICVNAFNHVNYLWTTIIFCLYPAIASSCMRTRSLPFASFKCNWVDFSTLPLTFCLNHKCQQIVIESPYLAHLRKKEVFIIAKWGWWARKRVCKREKTPLG